MKEQRENPYDEHEPNAHVTNPFDEVVATARNTSLTCVSDEVAIAFMQPALVIENTSLVVVATPVPVVEAT